MTESCHSFRALDPTSEKDTIQRLEVTATNIRMWMDSFLKMNTEKTRILVVLPPRYGKAIDIPSLNNGLDGTPLAPIAA